MATLQVPPRLTSQLSRNYDDFDSRLAPPSPSISSIDMQEGSKKTMQTTVAIRDEKPHHFKIRPLKHVPVEKRPTEKLPALYQLAPDRAASACSFNSLNDEHPSVSRPGSPPPQRQRVRGLSSASEVKSDYSSFKDEHSVSGFEASSNSQVGSFGSLRSTAGDISQEDIVQALQTYDASQASLSHPWSAPPDLTFDTSRELSASPGLVTPLTSTPSSESVRKTKSMHVASSGRGFISKLPLDPPALSRASILQRRDRNRTKAFSVSSLSTGHSKEENPTHNRKRHAIYGDSEWQVDLPPSSDSQSSLGESAFPGSGSSRSLSYVAPRFFGKEINSRHTSTRSDVSSRFGLGLKNSMSTPIVPTILSLPSFDQPSVLPLKVSTSRTSIKSIEPALLDRASTPTWPPLVQEMLDEIDEAILEWQFTCFAASF
ncbi:hypothetical protein BDY19DRAFT_910029 [Irpex rosettiformis]|uniref:Uncharacterized protein n=1 Tax=Irpex rosettiformis TaxID=378272 RepID=A0ACB8TQ55_9APHY|nr:hypothetical protein BDY19DRAFT_910029 [Irpex rosettiformis]